MLFVLSEWRCDAGGAERCLSDLGTSCIPLQGNIKCYGCMPGYEPKIANDESGCQGKKFYFSLAKNLKMQLNGYIGFVYFYVAVPNGKHNYQYDGTAQCNDKYMIK